MSAQTKDEALAQAAATLGEPGARATVRQALDRLWELAFEQGKLAALDELQDRFCVCMK